MIQRTPRFFILMLVLSAGAGAALAQSAPQEAAQTAASTPEKDAVKQAEPAATAPAEGRKARASFDVYGDYTFSSDFSDSNGDVSVWRAGASLDMLFPVGERSDFGASLRGERWGFNFDNATGFAADGEPWTDINDFAMLLSFKHQCTDRWSASVGGGLESAFADGANFGDSLSGGGFVAASYKFSDTFTAGLGVSVRTRLEDNVSVFPVLLLDWKISDKWSLGTSPSIGRRLFSLSYKPCESATISFGGGVEFLDFRLDSDAATSEGVGRYRRIPVGVEVAWKISDQVTLGVYGGAQVWQEYTLDDREGNRVFQDDAGVAPFAGASLEWRF
ncbi:MAG: hypothetical protein JSR77_07900 [Planctomycetes bacterium]|nr:hypothetical protein [Planctomycetota bacterium]